jgi:hypothetical protein
MRAIRCKRLNQTLTVALGQWSRTTRSRNTVFYRLEFDIETKKNLALDLEVLVMAMVVGTYTASTPTRYARGQQCRWRDSEGSIEPGSKIFNCPARSPTLVLMPARLTTAAGTSNALGHGFRLRPTAGEGSLEGGSDTGIFSKIFLTEAVIGVLGLHAADQQHATPVRR